jgi:hypothetical protein
VVSGLRRLGSLVSAENVSGRQFVSWITTKIFVALVSSAEDLCGR